MASRPDSTQPESGTPDPEAALLREVVASVLDRMEEEGESALDAACREHPTLAARIRKRVARLAGLGLAPVVETEFPERLGDFRLLERLGSGGMGVVYRAWQESLQRHVAVKLVRPEHLYFPGARERFRREADAVAKLSHPGIVSIYTVGEEAGLPFFTMELVAGCTLSDLVAGLQGSEPRALSGRDVASVLARFAPTPDVAMDPIARFGRTWTDVVLGLIRKVVEALEHAHTRGILHRDLKPSNVMVTPEGRVVLMDFGLALAEGNTKLTRTGALLGSIPYMSPEQLRGEVAGIGAHSDVYSIGVLLYELLALRPPFFAESSEATRELVLRGSPAPLRERNSSVPPEVETICACAMDIDPLRRYRNATALMRDLDAFAARRPISARPAGTLLRLRRTIQRHPVHAAVLVLGTAIVLGGPLAYAIGVAQQRDAALLAQQRAERQTYAAQIAVADVSLRVDDVLGCKRALAGCPEPLRGWEWQYMSGQTDTARRVLRLPENRVPREVVYDWAESQLIVRDENGALWRLPAEVDGAAASLDLPGKRALGIAAHPKLPRLLVVSEDGHCGIYDLLGGKLIADLGTVRRPAPQCAFSHDGSSVVVADQDGQVHVLDSETGRETNTLAIWPQTGRLAMTRISTGQDVVIGRAQDGQLALFDIATGQPCRTFEDTYRTTLFAANRAGTRIAASTGTMLVRSHRLEPPERSITISQDYGLIRWMGFAADDDSLLTAHSDGTLREWNVVSQGEAVGVFHGHERALFSAAVSTRRGEAATCSGDGTIRIWGAGDHRGAKAYLTREPWFAASPAVEVAAALLSLGDGETSAVGLESGAIEIRAEPWRAVRTLAGHARCVSALAGAKGNDTLWSGSADHTIRAWSLASGGETFRIACNDHVPVALFLTADGAGLWSVGAEDSVRLWSTKNGELVANFAVPGAGTGLAELDRAGTTLYVRKAEGELVAVTARGTIAPDLRADVQPASTRNGTETFLRAAAREPTLLGRNVFSRPLIALSPDGRRLAVCNEQFGVRIVDAQDGANLLGLANRGAPVHAIAWSARGDAVLVSLRNGYTQVWSSRPRSATEAEVQPRMPDHDLAIERLREHKLSTPTRDLVAKVNSAPDLTTATRQRISALLGFRPPEPERFLLDARRLLLYLEEGDETVESGIDCARAAAAALPNSALAHVYVAIGAVRKGNGNAARDAIELARAAFVNDPLDVHPLLPGVEAWLAIVEDRLDDAQTLLDAGWRLKNKPANRADRLVTGFLQHVAKELDRARH